MSTNLVVTGRQGASIPVFEVPRPAPAPLLVMIPSIFGIGPDVVDVAKHFGATGARVWVLDSFWRTVPGPLVFDEPGIAAAMARMKAHDRTHTTNDLIDLLAAGRAQGHAKALVLGVCFGGRFAFAAAADGHVQAAAAWHGVGMGEQVGRAADVKCPLSLDFAELDNSVPLQEVDRLRAAFAGRPDVAIRLHKGAVHGFSHANVPERYHPEAAKAAIDGVDGLIRTLAAP